MKASASRCLLLLLAWQAVNLPFVVAAADWEILEGCRLLPNIANDGDSFHVAHRGKEYIFRLYFVDAPETSEEIPARVAEQAKAFGVPRDRVMKAGKEAAEFTKQKLSRPFTVRTKWQDAEGQSRLPRRFALVETADGKDLGELLAAAGYVRSFGAAAAPPGKNESALRATYDRLANRAKATRLGAWGSKNSSIVGTLSDDGASGEGDPAAEAGETGIMPELPGMDSMMDSLQVVPDSMTP